MPPSVERLPVDRARGRRTRGRIVLVTAARDWHARMLVAAFRRRGLSVAALPLEACAFDSTAPHGLRIGAVEDLPDGVLVRTVSAGSFEVVTRRLGVLHALEALGVAGELVAEEGFHRDRYRDREQHAKCAKVSRRTRKRKPCNTDFRSSFRDFRETFAPFAYESPASCRLRARVANALCAGRGARRPAPSAGALRRRRHAARPGCRAASFA